MEISIFRFICFDPFSLNTLNPLSNEVLFKFVYFAVDVIKIGNGALDIDVIASTTPSFKFSPI